ncbi:T-cell surface antigen CD2-like [Salvelinus namaycush]|uniref:T-cell surface antigen CD2-like n=1 Tax=Salvelinus namaycush TaxID=8040 RepID=A0A8U0Q440_SALNM|nr:T-cell surface antigen CD2-like [Salvelinus namaycush]XP_038835807.1 T-cell surface antigen CD2-like [Salvelinus namaycush]
MACTLPLAFLVLHGFLSLSADSCDYYLQPGTDFSIPLKYTDLSSKEITWKHNEKVILKRKNGMFKPGKAEDILDDGSLQLKGLALANKGTYKAEVFNSDGTSILERSFSLCMKVSKPSVEITCSAKYITFTCILTNTEGVTFKWSKNRQPINEKTKILTIGLIELKELDAFTCSAVNEVSTETSDIIKPTCNAVSKSGDRHSLFGFDFLTMVGILAGGGGLVLLLIIITLVCCCLSRRKSQTRFEEERELRLAPLTKTQHPYHPEGQTKHPSHPEGQKQRQRPPGGAPPGSTGPRPTARASSQAAPQPRAQARGRLPQTPMDDDEEQPPPLPQPRKKGPHPSRQ